MMCILFLLVTAFILLNSKGIFERFDRSDRNNALALLNEKYAKGEISDDEYEKRKKILSA
ncbi:SHOCT domain-containing protein [Thermovenabulum sp.]|uniref:SHOCT domain-containing protein n=1 Tax=Thermovenabulum sp. TaxID=3100335 RepID=UPI003C7D5347